MSWRHSGSPGPTASEVERPPLGLGGGPMGGLGGGDGVSGSLSSLPAVLTRQKRIFAVEPVVQGRGP